MSMLQKRLKDLAFPAIVIAGVAIFTTVGRSETVSAKYSYDGAPEVIAATFSSAWCSSCKILEPRLAAVIPDFADKPIKFVDLDFTLGERPEIEREAAADGLSEIYPRFKGATGFTLLVDHNTGEIIDMLTINHDQNAMRAAIAQAIAIAARNDKSAPHVTKTY